MVERKSGPITTTAIADMKYINLDPGMKVDGSFWRFRLENGAHVWMGIVLPDYVPSIGRRVVYEEVVPGVFEIKWPVGANKGEVWVILREFQGFFRPGNAPKDQPIPEKVTAMPERYKVLVDPFGDNPGTKIDEII